MSAKPRLTIGMPVYNGEQYIGAAIESLLNQTFTDFELVISDNGSTDETENICRRFESLDKRVTYIRQAENRGAIANFNCLVEFAQGEYFKWAAHDDVCEPNYLEECVQVLDSNPELAWVHSDSDMIDEKGDSWLIRMPEDDEEVAIDSLGNRRWAGLPRADHESDRPSKRFAGVLLGTRWCVDSYGVMRTEFLRRTGLYPNLYGAEKVLMGELSLLGKTFQIPFVLFKQRIHPAASAYQESETAQQQFVAARDARPFTVTRLSLFLAHLRVVRSAPISSYERLCCYMVLLKYLCQCRKWFRVVRGLIKRSGVGGGGRRIIEAASRSTKRTSHRGAHP